MNTCEYSCQNLILAKNISGNYPLNKCMNFKSLVFGACLLFVSGTMLAQNPDPYLPDNTAPKEIPGMSLVWHDEFNLAVGGNGGDPSESLFPIKYEVDYVRVYQSK